MNSPVWYKSRLDSWGKNKKRSFKMKKKPKLNEVKQQCETCKTDMSLTPQGFVCYYCQFSSTEIDL